MKPFLLHANNDQTNSAVIRHISVWAGNPGDPDDAFLSHEMILVFYTTRKIKLYVVSFLLKISEEKELSSEHKDANTDC
jgi:hypothetical protein